MRSFWYKFKGIEDFVFSKSQLVFNLSHILDIYRLITRVPILPTRTSTYSPKFRKQHLPQDVFKIYITFLIPQHI